MTTTNTLLDDFGTRGLRAVNEAAHGSKPVAPADATPPIQSSVEEPPSTQPPKWDRRQGERRKRDVPVLLDTRDKRERRRQFQLSETAEMEEPAVRGIDVYS